MLQIKIKKLKTELLFGFFVVIFYAIAMVLTLARKKS